MATALILSGGGEGEGGADDKEVAQNNVKVDLPADLDLGDFKDGDEIEVCGTLRGRTLIAKSVEAGDEAEEADEDKENEAPDDADDSDSARKPVRSINDLFSSYDKAKR